MKPPEIKTSADLDRLFDSKPPGNTAEPALPPAPKVVVPKKLDAASEALLGLLNGTLVGGLLASAGSFSYFAVRKWGLKQHVTFLGDIKSTQLGVMLGGTAAVGVINALVRTSHAFQHNAWCAKVDEKVSHMERVEAEKTKPVTTQKS